MGRVLSIEKMFEFNNIDEALGMNEKSWWLHVDHKK